LELPPQFKIHNVFHVSLLEPYHENQIPEHHRESPAPVKIEGQEEFKVQEVLDCKKIHGKLLYLVFWRGYPPSEGTWEPAENLIHAQDLINQFHKRYPNKPAPFGRYRLRRDNVMAWIQQHKSRVHRSISAVLPCLSIAAVQQCSHISEVQ